jgi:hypothetical protein
MTHSRCAANADCPRPPGRDGRCDLHEAVALAAESREYADKAALALDRLVSADLVSDAARWRSQRDELRGALREMVEVFAPRGSFGQVTATQEDALYDARTALRHVEEAL